MKLMQNSGVPIYQQIADSFKTDILAGRYEQGEFLPSIRGLAKDLKISVITTMKAYEQLADEGLITAAQGKGFYGLYHHSWHSLTIKSYSASGSVRFHSSVLSEDQTL